MENTERRCLDFLLRNSSSTGRHIIGLWLMIILLFVLHLVDAETDRRSDRMIDNLQKQIDILSE